MPELAQRVQVHHVVRGSAPSACVPRATGPLECRRKGGWAGVPGDAQAFFVNHSLQTRLLASVTVAACWETSSGTPAGRPV